MIVDEFESMDFSLHIGVIERCEKNFIESKINEDGLIIIGFFHGSIDEISHTLSTKKMIERKIIMKGRKGYNSDK